MKHTESSDHNYFSAFTIPSASLDSLVNFAAMNVNPQHGMLDTTPPQHKQGISGNETFDGKPTNSGPSGHPEGHEKKTTETRHDPMGHRQGHGGAAAEHEKLVPENNARPNPTDCDVSDTQTHGYAQPTGRREKFDNPSPEVKSRTVHEDRNNNDLTRSTRAENSLSDDAKKRIAKNEGNLVTSCLLQTNRTPENDGKRYKKALKKEAKVEDDTLKTKMKELERLQKVHKQSAKVGFVKIARDHTPTFFRTKRQQWHHTPKRSRTNIS